METLPAQYARLLHVGFLVLQQTLDSQDYDWLPVEMDLLHNVPSLISERNVERHRYFWFGERKYYIDRVAASGRDDLNARMRTFYLPVWQEMEPILLEWFADESAPKSPSAR